MAYKFFLPTFSLLILLLVFSSFSHSLILFPATLAQNSPSLPVLRPYVNDYADVLTQDEISSINSLATQIEKNSTVQVAVLIVKTTQPLSIDQYANQVFRASGIGHKDNNNGVLVMVATEDRKWRIEVGYGVEGVLPDALAGQIGLTYLVPNFQQGNYGQGLYLAVQSIGNIIEGSGDSYLISKDTSSVSSNIDLFFTFFPLIILVVIPMIFVASSDIARCPKCGKITLGKNQGDQVVFVCKNGHRWTKKRKSRWFWWFFGTGMGGGWGGGGGGGGGFGGGSSGGGGAGGGY